MPDADGAAANDDDTKDPKPAKKSRDDDDDPDHQPEKGDDSGDDGEHVEKEEESAAPSPKEPTPPPQPMVRRKRLGRPPKNRPPDWDNTIMVPADEVRDTPRRRGRGGWRGRGGRKGGPPAPKAEQVIDAEGTIAEIANDECVLPEDPEGEQKVDKLGNLQGGRDYRCRVFTVLGRGNRLYMLSTEPARCVGFRDSYLFFTKHRKLHKIIVDDDEKRDMIEREIIPHSYKGRSIGIVTARSVFREFGARIIVGGKRILDDYNVTQARADGVVEGQLADPDDHFVPGEPYNKNQYVAWHGASAVYHTNVPSVPAPSGKPEYKKRKVNVNDMNWMLEHAREARYVKRHHPAPACPCASFVEGGNCSLTVSLQHLQLGHQRPQKGQQRRSLRHPYQRHAVPGYHAADACAHRAGRPRRRGGHPWQRYVPAGPPQDGAQLLYCGHVPRDATRGCRTGGVRRPSGLDGPGRRVPRPRGRVGRHQGPPSAAVPRCL